VGESFACFWDEYYQTNICQDPSVIGKEELSQHEAFVTPVRKKYKKALFGRRKEKTSKKTTFNCDNSFILSQYNSKDELWPNQKVTDPVFKEEQSIVAVERVHRPESSVDKLHQEVSKYNAQEISPWLFDDVDFHSFDKDAS
jgi:hypothetical protein